MGQDMDILWCQWQYILILILITVLSRTIPRENTKMLKIEDLNSIIKYFTNEIYQRFLQLQSQHQLISPQSQSQSQYNNNNNYQNQQHQKIQSLITQYTGYTPSSETQLEYVKKMMQRILQIFGFYKWKCRSQGVLGHVERQIGSRVGVFSNEGCRDVGKIMGYFVDLCRRPFVSRPSNIVTAMRPITPTCTAATTTTTTTAKRTTCQAFLTTSMPKQKRKLHSKSETRQTLPLEPPQKQPIFQQKKRRTTSVMCYNYNPNYNHNYSTSSQLQVQVQLIDVIDKLYSCMNIDRGHLVRVIESENFLTRDQFKRNRSTMKKLQVMEALVKEKEREKDKQRERQREKQKEREKQRLISNLAQRKIKTQPNQHSKQKKILSQLKTNTHIFEYNYTQFLEEQKQKKAPMMNLSILNKKRCKVKTFCMKKNKEKKNFNFNNENNFI